MVKGGKLDPFSQDCLDAHNNYRAKHGVPPLMWSRELADGAQNWADQLASTDSLQHDEVAIHNRKMGKFMKLLSCTYLVDWYRKRLIPISKERFREFFKTEFYPRSPLDQLTPALPSPIFTAVTETNSLSWVLFCKDSVRELMGLMK